MRRPNDARLRPWIFTLAALSVLAPAWAARIVQDDVVLDGVPAIGAEVVADIDAGLARFRGGNEAHLLDWQSDGSLLVAVRSKGSDQLLRLRGSATGDAASAGDSIGAPGGTISTAAAQAFQADALAFVAGDATRDGDALQLASLADGSVRQLLPASVHPGAPAWAHDGRQVAVSATLPESPGKSNVYVLDAATAGNSAATPRLALGGQDGSLQVIEWANADRALLVRHRRADGYDELLLVDLGAGSTRRIDAPGEQAGIAGHIGEAHLRSDGRGVYFIGDRGGEHMQLHYVDMVTNIDELLAPDLDVAHFDVNASDHTIALSWSEFGYSRVALLDRASGKLTMLSTLPAGGVDALRFDRAGARLAIEVAPSAAPRDVYVHDVAAGTNTRWTRSQMGELNAAQLAAAQSVRFPTWDRVGGGRSRVLTALLYRPQGNGPWPVIVMIGDAGLQARAQLDPFVQYCVNDLKAAVVVPSLRSGEPGALDAGALLAWLNAQPDLRHDRIVLHGRGSGGTLALAALGLYGDRLRGAVDIDGAATPLQLVSLRAPVLLVRGLQSSPLDAGAAEQLLWRLRSTGVESWFVAPRDLNGTLGAEQEQATAQRVIAQFLRVRLGN